MPAARFLLSLAVCLLSLAVLAADELPPRAVARLGDYRFYHGDKLGCYAINYDGRRVATGDCGISADHCQVIVWDGTTGEELRRWKIPGGGISCLDISPDGKRIAVGCCVHKDEVNDLFVFDVESGKLVHRLAEFKNGVVKVQFSRDGKRLLVSEGSEKWFSDPAVSCWDAATGKRLKRWTPPVIPPHETDKDYTKWTVDSGLLSPNEKIVFWHMDVEVQTPKGSVDLAKHSFIIRAYDSDTKKQIYELEANDLPKTFSFDGNRFVLNDRFYVVRQTTTGKTIHELEAESLIRIAALPPNEKRVLVATHDSYQLWDFQTGELPHALEGRILSRGRRPCLISGDGQTVLFMFENIVQPWDPKIGKERVSTSGHRSLIESLWFSADGHTLVSQCEGATCKWNVVQAKQVSHWVPFLTLEDEISEHRSPDARLALVSPLTGRTLEVRDTKDRKMLCRLEMPDYSVWHGGTFSPAGDKVALQRPPRHESLEWFDTATGKRLGKIPEAFCRMPPVFSPNSRLLAWVKGQSIQIADATSGRLLRSLDLRLDEQFRPVSLLTFSPDNEFLAVSKFGWRGRGDTLDPVPVRIFHVPSGKEMARFFVHAEDDGKSDAPVAMAISPDNRLLAVAENEITATRVLEVASGRTRLMLSGHRSMPTTLAFSPDGKTLASGGSDSVIYLWDATGTRSKASGKELDESAHWDALSGIDAVRAGEALAALVRKSDHSVAFLKERLRPVEAVAAKRLARLIADLDADAFETREAASRELARLGELVEPALGRALKDDVQPEAKRRLEELLEKLDRRSLPPETLRELRAVEALEHIGTPEARRLLEALATGAPEARLTLDAKATLKRLDGRNRP
jgi:WD40 repeat protein